MMRPTRVAIIGTAGRKEDARKMSAAVFARMVQHAAHAQRAVWQLPNERVILVSGGSAWADHVAVKLFVDQAMDPEGAPYAGLYLFLPCELSSAGAAGQGVRFADTGSVDWRSNPGRLLNQLHAAFTRAVGHDTLNDVAVARAFGAKLSYEGRGFHQRNKLVAGQADRMLAYTWGSDRAQPKDGGTMHTWKLVLPRAVKMHVPLADLMSGAIATAETKPLHAPAATPVTDVLSSAVQPFPLFTNVISALSSKRVSPAPSSSSSNLLGKRKPDTLHSLPDKAAQQLPVSQQGSSLDGEREEDSSKRLRTDAKTGKPGSASSFLLRTGAGAASASAAGSTVQEPITIE